MSGDGGTWLPVILNICPTGHADVPQFDGSPFGPRRKHRPCQAYDQTEGVILAGKHLHVPFIELHLGTLGARAYPMQS